MRGVRNAVVQNSSPDLRRRFGGEGDTPEVFQVRGVGFDELNSVGAKFFDCADLCHYTRVELRAAQVAHHHGRSDRKLSLELNCGAMAVEVRRRCRRILEVGFQMVLAGEPYRSAEADASAASLKNGSVRRKGRSLSGRGLEFLLDGRSVRDFEGRDNLQSLPLAGYRCIVV